MITTLEMRLFMSKEVYFCPKCGSIKVKKTEYLGWENVVREKLAKLFHKEISLMRVNRFDCLDCKNIWYENKV